MSKLMRVQFRAFMVVHEEHADEARMNLATEISEMACEDIFNNIEILRDWGAREEDACDDL